MEREYVPHRPLRCYNNEIRQVLANLIGNALDAMPAGGKLRIRIREVHSWDDTRHQGLRITIGGSGHGIQPAIRRRLYEPFVTTRGSTGLGLWVSDGIIRKHGGKIRVHSRVGEIGRFFRCSFPSTVCPMTVPNFGNSFLTREIPLQ